jgi:hypothetical protein
MRFDAVGVGLGLRPTIVPRAIRAIQSAHGLERQAGLRRNAFVLRIPDDDGRMIPTLLHPGGVLGNDLGGGRILRALVAFASKQPDGELVLDQDAHFIGDVVPELRREADAVAERVPAHFLDPLVEPANPVGAPGPVVAFRVLEEAVEGDIAAPQEVRLAIEHRATAGGIEVE